MQLRKNSSNPRRKVNEMKMTLEGRETIVTVEQQGDDLAIGDMFDQIIIPVLLAYGFSRKLIDECMGGP